jgi:O-antigen/teichoic acid export membrane protein
LKFNEFNVKIQYKLNEIRDREQQAIKTMARGAGIVFVGMITARVLGYALRVLLKRHLGLDDFGLVSTGVVIVEIATMLSVMGLPQAIARFIAFHLSRKEYSKVAGTLKASVIIGLPSVFLIGGLVYVLASFLANHIFQKPGLLYVLHRFWLLIPLFGITMLSSSILRGLKKMLGMIFSQQIARNLFVLFCFVPLALVGFKLDAAIYGYIYGFIIMAAVSLLLVVRAVHYKELFAQMPAKMTSAIVTYSWSLVFSTILWFLIGRVDTLFLASFMTIA